MKRVVTGVNAEGRSYVASSDKLPAQQGITVWEFDPNSSVRDWIAAIDPAVLADGPRVPGGGQWICATLLPGFVEKGPGVDKNGFHTTRTIDFDFIVEGDLVMILDEETVHLHKGDFVIQQATRHAWRNESGEPAILLAFLLRPADVGTSCPRAVHPR